MGQRSRDNSLSHETLQESFPFAMQESPSNASPMQEISDNLDKIMLEHTNEGRGNKTEANQVNEKKVMKFKSVTYLGDWRFIVTILYAQRFN